MRWIATLGALFCLLAIAAAQTSSVSLFDSVRPQATVKIEKHPLGADMVEITLLDQDYPVSTLREQVKRLGVELKSAPRGLLVYEHDMNPDDNKSRFLRATFAVDGLTDPSTGTYRIGPLARALTGAPKGHEIRGFALFYQGLKPGAQTIQSFGAKPDSPIRVEGRYVGLLTGLEYRVALNTQDPEKINIPDTVSQVPAPTPPAPLHPKSGSIWPIYVGSGIGAIAIGALVYSISRRRPKRRFEPPTRRSTRGNSSTR